MLLTGALLAGITLYFGKQAYQNIKQKSLENLSGKKKLVDSQKDNEKEIDKNLILSASLLGLTIAGTVYPILMPLGIVGLTYMNMPFILRGYQELVQERQIKSGVLDAIITIVLLGLSYFFAMALFFIFYYSSQKLLLKTQDKSKQSLINILGEVPQFVWVIRKGVERRLLFEKVQIGDIIPIHTGETIPVDGVIMEGMGRIDQHKLTGEAQLVEKTVGDQVLASTLLMSGKLYIRVDKAGKETVAAQIGEILNRTVDYKSSLQSKGELIVDKSAIPTLAIGAITLPILGPASAATALLAAFGYNMRIIAPISVLNYLKVASERGVLIKDGRALELLQQIDTVVFDKTGTLTQEQPSLGTIYCCATYTENEILCYAATAEYKQTHPIARAILLEARNRNLGLLSIDEAGYEMGYGLKVKVEEKRILVGSARFMAMENIVIPADISAIQAKCHEQGISLVYVAVDKQLGGAIEIRTTVRPEAKQVINQLRQRGMTLAIISGDRQEPTRQLATELEIDHYFAETLPENKADLIKQLQKEGKSICFVGDGINDSIALKTANVSISLRGASTIATDTAQIILMNESLNHLPGLFDLSNNFDYNMKKIWLLLLYQV